MPLRFFFLERTLTSVDHQSLKKKEEGRKKKERHVYNQIFHVVSQLESLPIARCLTSKISLFSCINHAYFYTRSSNDIRFQWLPLY